MTEEISRQVLRTRPWRAAFIIVTSLVFLTGAVLSYSSAGWAHYFAAFACLAFAGVAGIAQIAEAQIVMDHELLETRELFVRHRYMASEILSVRAEGRSGVSLELANGRRAELPYLGFNSQPLAAILKTWLDRCRRGKA